MLFNQIFKLDSFIAIPDIENYIPLKMFLATVYAPRRKGRVRHVLVSRHNRRFGFQPAFRMP